jgi:predicted Zn-dependent protease
MKRANFLAALGLAVLLDSSACGAAVPASGKAARASENDVTTAAAHEAAKGDTLLEALLTELDRSKAQLKMDQVKAPYYIEYRVNDVDEYSAEAAFGAIRRSDRGQYRVLRVVVRIGDYTQDSYYNQGLGAASILPLDNDPIALRRQIWLLTDEAYKNAADAYAEKLSALKQFVAETTPIADFAKAPVICDVGEVVKLKIDQHSWDKTLEDATNLYKQFPEVQFVAADARFTAVNEYFVNSEGTIVRQGRTTATVTLNSYTQADDGMRLTRAPFWTEERAVDLPNREALLQESTKMLETLKALRAAPIVEESYRGPVLFAPDAANDIVAGLVGTNVIGRKPQLGRPNRTTGAFATSFKTRVLPKFVTVVDDPTESSFDGKKLVGSYEVDSEGVKARQVTLVNQGVLESYLTGRQPLRDFPNSNGHGRAAPGGAPIPSLGVLLVKGSDAETPQALNEQLRHMAAEADKPYGYRVETLGPGNEPRLLYRVYVKDGHEELVRGAIFNELDVRTLRNDLVAIGNDPEVSNRANGLPQTIICPSFLFDELEVKRADTTKQKLPEYPPPAIKR